MKNPRLFSILVLLSAMPWIPQMAYAVDCATPSPNMVTSHNFWAAVPAEKLSDAEETQLLDFLKSIVGSWKGTGKETRCMPVGRTTEKKQIPQEVRLKVVQQGDGEFSFNVDVFDTVNQLTTQYNFELENTVQGMQVPGEGGIELGKLSDTGLLFRSQTAAPNRGGYKISLENVRGLSVSDGELTFYKAEFSNGVLSSVSNWVFSKD